LGKEGKVDGFEISLSSAYPTVLAGLDDSLIIGPRHDDLAMVFAIAKGFAEIKNGTSSDKTVVAGYFDAEETGSTTSSGARSTFLTHTLSKICKSHPSWDPSEHIENAFSQSFHISADMAHGFHPAYAQKFDVNHKVLLNKGIVVKENANDRYATNGQSASIFRGFCELAKIPVQNFVNRQDLGCGSTIGPSVSALLNCIGVDIGAPMWSMHSTAETMGTYDLYYSKLLMQTFFN
jgi:aspartyl aminopeptidase